jgi:Glu-tRNA(Gln) amidotransferase subunit E-like FAD-binding protein
MSLQEEMSKCQYTKIALDTNKSFRDINLLATLISIYGDIVGDAKHEELTRIAGIFANTMPSPITDDGLRNDLHYNCYTKYMAIAIYLTAWTEVDRKIIANLIVELLLLNPFICLIELHRLVELLLLVKSGTVDHKNLKPILNEMILKEGIVLDIVIRLGLEQGNNGDLLLGIITEQIQNSPNEVQQYVNGNQKILGFFVGKIMKQLTVKVNPAEINKFLKQELDKL